MDWRLIGLTASGTWFLLLVIDDVTALLKVPPQFTAQGRNVAFVVALGLFVILGVLVLQGQHGRCAVGTPVAA